jgi:hypothetical protein
MKHSFASFLTSFANGHLAKHPAVAFAALRTMSLGQSAVGFAFFMNEEYSRSWTVAPFALLFPLFLLLGAATGAMAITAGTNGRLLVVAGTMFAALTAVNYVALILFLAFVNWIAAIALFVSLIAALWLFGQGASLYMKFSPPIEETDTHKSSQIRKNG